MLAGATRVNRLMGYTETIIAVNHWGGDYDIQADSIFHRKAASLGSFTPTMLFQCSAFLLLTEV
jgi:hypothetical protein